MIGHDDDDDMPDTPGVLTMRDPEFWFDRNLRLKWTRAERIQMLVHKLAELRREITRVHILIADVEGIIEPPTKETWDVTDEFMLANDLGAEFIELQNVLLELSDAGEAARDYITGMARANPALQIAPP